MRQFVSVLVLIFAGVAIALFTDEENARLPRLFHLDDYDRCISQKDGLYCLGIFELSPIEPSSVFEYIKEYSSNTFTFNRSRLHRGYCVSERCPSRERNATLRFERCVSERARRHAMSARLHTLQHCTSHKQHKAKLAQPPDAAQRLFLQIVCAILVLNFVGTAYDVATGDDRNKIGILAAWSVRGSWRRLTATYDNGDPRLKELELLHGIRVVSALFTLYAHACVYHFQYYVINPQFLEKLSDRFDGVMMANGTSLIQAITMISNFLTGYSLLLYSQTSKLSLTMLPVLIIKRVSRLAPVHLLLIGFTATWWPRMFPGPFQSHMEDESVICRNKFWSHAFFYNNMVDKHNLCLVPSWFIPVDMHLYILACILVIVMQHKKQQARRLFAICFIITSLACGVVTYVTGWQAMVYFAVPDNIRGIFRNVESFGEFYVSTWGSLPACFLGLYMAYLYHELRDNKNDYRFNKWIITLHNLSLPILIVWVIILGSFVRHYKQTLVTAAYVAIDRPVFIVGMFFYTFGVFKIDGFWRRLYNWKGWRIPARLSLPVILCHWLVNCYIVARPVAYHTGVFDVNIDYLATVIYSHLLAVPISLLVEIPMQRFISQFV